MEKESIEKINYKQLGFKAGLEIHQQLSTHKLFCSCLSFLSEYYDKTIERTMTLVSSEMKKTDFAAKQEHEKKKIFEYQFSDSYACLIDIDENPPQSPNPEALETAAVFSRLVGAKILPYAKVMRKIVIDGSNTTGFQKTMLFSLGGEIPISNKKIRIQTIVLEEDSARQIEKNSKKTIYRLDRLGIPLIEIATEPDISTPEEAKECALKIGELLRLTCKAQRGKGTIRQDLNVSISEGSRVEIKGVQELEMIDTHIEREVQRQVSLLSLKKKIPSSLSFTSLENLSHLFSNSQSKLVREKEIFGFGLKNFANLLCFEIQPNRRFASELSDYVKAKTSLTGLIHSDELPAYGITQEEKNSIFSHLNLSPSDAFIFFISSKELSEKARQICIERIQIAQSRIPEETRQALEDGNSSFMRALGGADRMYPETDLPPIPLSNYSKISLPLSLPERDKLYKKKGLSENHIREMRLSNYACLFHSLLSKNYDPILTATTLLDTNNKLLRKGISLKTEHLLKALKLNKENKLPNSQIEEALISFAQGKEFTPFSFSEENLSQEIKSLLSKNKILIQEKQMSALGPLMGDLKKSNSQVPPELLSKLLKKELEFFLKNLQ